MRYIMCSALCLWLDANSQLQLEQFVLTSMQYNTIQYLYFCAGAMVTVVSDSLTSAIPTVASGARGGCIGELQLCAAGPLRNRSRHVKFHFQVYVQYFMVLMSKILLQSASYLPFDSWLKFVQKFRSHPLSRPHTTWHSAGDSAFA